MASDNAGRAEAVSASPREIEMKYWLYNLQSGRPMGGSKEDTEVYNVSYKEPGNRDFILLIVEDGNRIEMHTLGAGCQITVDVEKPRSAGE